MTVVRTKRLVRKVETQDTPSPQETTQELVNSVEFEDTTSSGFIPIKARAEELKEKATIPSPPTNHPTFPELAEWMKLLTPAHWGKMTVYVYRTFPRIVRQLVDEDAHKYIDKFGEAFTESDIIKRHGGGKYEFRVSTTAGKQIARSTLAIDHNQYDPILNVEELDAGYSDNKSFIDLLTAKGIAEKKDGRVVKMNPNQSNNDVVKEAFSFMKEQVKESQKAPVNNSGLAESAVTQAVGIIGEAVKQSAAMNDPSRIMDMMVKMQQMMNPPVAASSSDSGNIMMQMQMQFMQMMMTSMNQMQQQQMEAAKNNLEMMMKLLETKTTKEEPEEKESDFDKFAKMLELAKMVKGGGGVSSIAEPSMLEQAMKYLIPVAAPLLQGVGSAIASGGFKLPGAMPGMPSTPPQPGMGSALTPQQMITASEQPIAGGAIAGINEINQGDEMLKTNIRQYGQFIITAIGEGADGYNFAENLIGLAGVPGWRMLANHGVDKLFETMKSIPEFYTVLTQVQPNEEKLKAWIGEFCGWEEWSKTQDEGEGE